MKKERLTETQIQTIEGQIPYDLPIEELRRWFISESKDVDTRRSYLKEQLKNGVPKSKAADLEKELDFLYLKRDYIYQKLRSVKQAIKKRNVAMHSLNPGEVNVFIEMIQILEERDPDLKHDLYIEAKANILARHGGHIEQQKTG